MSKVRIDYNTLGSLLGQPFMEDPNRHPNMDGGIVGRSSAVGGECRVHGIGGVYGQGRIGE